MKKITCFFVLMMMLGCGNENGITLPQGSVEDDISIDSALMDEFNRSMENRQRDPVHSLVIALGAMSRKTGRPMVALARKLDEKQVLNCDENGICLLANKENK